MFSTLTMKVNKTLNAFTLLPKKYMYQCSLNSGRLQKWLGAISARRHGVRKFI